MCTYGDASESLSKAESVNQQRAKLDGVRQKECDQWDMKISLASAKYVVLSRQVASKRRNTATCSSYVLQNFFGDALMVIVQALGVESIFN